MATATKFGVLVRTINPVANALRVLLKFFHDLPLITTMLVCIHNYDIEIAILNLSDTAIERGTVSNTSSL